MTDALKPGVAAKTNQPPSQDVGELGKRTAFLRKQRGLSLDELAAASGLTKGYLSKVERGRSVPSISTALRIANSFNLSMGQLLGDAEVSDDVSVVRKSERRPFMRGHTASGWNYESMAGHKALRAMDPFIMRPPREFDDDKMFQHVGEEFMLVLKGVVEIEFPSRRIRLEEGDSLYFDAHLLHRTRCIGELAEVLVVVHAPPAKS
jgi:transcriptional regulator with XRE-family HTH domain